MDLARLRFEVLKLFWRPGPLFIEMRGSGAQRSVEDPNHRTGTLFAAAP
jgi:hypothetical protein